MTLAMKLAGAKYTEGLGGGGTEIIFSYLNTDTVFKYYCAHFSVFKELEDDILVEIQELYCLQLGRFLFSWHLF